MSDLVEKNLKDIEVIKSIKSLIKNFKYRVGKSVHFRFSYKTKMVFSQIFCISTKTTY